MVKIAFEGFDGEIPRADPHYLPEKNAVEARNVKLTGGTLRPLREPINTLTYPENGRSAIAFHKGTWLSWFQDADVVPGPVADNRLYVSRENDPPQLYRNAEFLPLALPTPTGKPTVTRTGTLDPDLAERVLYCFTNVTGMGEETKPSPFSDFIDFSPGTTITIGNLPAFTELAGRGSLVQRIYRSQTTASGQTELFFIGTSPAGTTTFVDAWGARPLAEPLPSIDYDPPPDTLRGIVAMPNGIIAGFSGREVLFCEPFIPHAWPIKYRQAVNDDIVGLVALGSSLVVLTVGTPYIIQGLHPEQMSMMKMEANLPCVSKRSIVDMGYSAVYASTSGLVRITEGGADLMSRELWSQDEWDALGPNTIFAARWGELYCFRYQAPVDLIRRVSMVNMNGDKPALVRSDVTARFLYTHPTNGRLYTLNNTGNIIQEFDAGAAMSMLWRSKRFRFTDPVSFARVLVELAAEADPVNAGAGAITNLYENDLIVALDGITLVSQDARAVTANIPDSLITANTADLVRVNIGSDATAEPWSVEIYANGNLLHTISQDAGRIQSVPAGEFRDWQFVIKGTAPILRVAIAQSATELAT